MLRVLLTDSLDIVLEDYAHALSRFFEIHTCTSGRQLEARLREVDPDLLLLDLSMPGYDPKKLLESLPAHRPLIIASTLCVNDYLTQLLEKHGVRWLMVKPLYSEMVAARFLELELELTDSPDKALRSAAYCVLLQAGVRLHSPGFMPLAEGIIYAGCHEEFSMIDDLYPHVARVCDSTEAAVEKAMHRSIEKAFSQRRLHIWTALFGTALKEECPTNSRFIMHLAHAIKKNNK